jgi:Tfp pilus assembly protein PilF
LIISIIGFSSCSEKNNCPKDTCAKWDTLTAKLDKDISNYNPHARDSVLKYMAIAPDSFTYNRLLISLGNYYRLGSKPDSMMICSKRVLKFTSTQKISDKKSDELKSLAYELAACYYYYFHNVSDTCINYHKLAYLYAQKSDMPQRLPDICANMADAYKQQDNIVEAAHWYRRALFIVDSLKLPHTSYVSLYMGLAGVYMELKDYNTSRSYYELTDKYFDKLQPNMQLGFLNNYGNLFYYTKDYKGALRQFRRLKSLIEKEGNGPNDINLCRLNMADVFLNLGQTDSAKQYVALADTYFKSIKMDAAIYYCNTIKIAIALKAGNEAEARKIIETEQVRTPSELSLIDIRGRYLRDYYLRTHNYKAAYESLESSYTRNDSLEHNKSHMRAAEIMMRFQQDTLALHKQIRIDQQEKEVRTAHTWLWAAICGTVIIILFFGILFIYTRKRTLQTQIDLLRLRLTNVRNRVSPHFIFNVLNHEINKQTDNDTESLVTLTKLLRTNLDISRHTYINLKEELDFVRLYVQAEKFLLGEDFTFNIETLDEETLKTITIPSMFVQILVENSIKHGLMLREGYKELNIRVSHNEAATDIIVRDNGMGLVADSNKNDANKTGLNIIRQTILILNEQNKKKMRFTIQNITDSTNKSIEGCEACIHIPSGMKMLE